ncbi:hypothetical protein ACO2Q9_14500 [Variovorax sp. VNK109]|uniref:hypothetical protein n=1 Tax=Variovorax sp. VNK109 TaxID=3400919 RepID=UPI003C0A40FF
MKHKWLRRLGLAACALAALIVMAAGALWLWLPSSEEIARRVEAEVQARLGVPVQIGAVHWGVWPTPYAEVLDARTVQHPEAITFRRLALFPDLGAALHRQIVMRRVELEGAVIPREAMRAFRGRESGVTEPGGEKADIPLRQFVFHDVTWISWSGVPVAYDGEILFDPLWLPRAATLVRPGVSPPARLDLTRVGTEDRWQTRIVIAGGTADGEVRLQTTPDGLMQLAGDLAPRGIEVEQAVATFHRRSPLAGFASGRTRIEASGQTAGELARSLHTVSELSVASGRVLRLDVDKAVRTLGKERAGQTPLDSLTGRVETQNTEQGMRVVYSDLEAHAGDYAARGEATVYQRHVKARGTLDTAGGAVAVPFTVEGPTRKPDFEIAPGFYAGAAIGTAILPGIGTVIGARIGGALGGAPAKSGKPDKPATPIKKGPVSPRLQ